MWVTEIAKPGPVSKLVRTLDDLYAVQPIKTRFLGWPTLEGLLYLSANAKATFWYCKP